VPVDTLEVVPRLIVNADDFGLTAGVNRAVVELHQAGLLTSATLMARAAATDEAVELARQNPALGVGCHVVLVDGDPMLSPANQIPHLADLVTGLFRPTLGAFLKPLLLGRIPSVEIEAEARAQIESLRQKGLVLDHIDTHKHVHMFPSVLRPVLRAAKACGIRRVRNPFEPAWSARATAGAPLVRRIEVALLHTLEKKFLRTVAEEDFQTTAGALGVLATGTLDPATIAALVTAAAAHSEEKIFELVAHPGYNDADLARVRTRLRESRDRERQALQALRQFPSVELIPFSGLV
jgi:predicted glycoside hydrolase/deacetylase ChbG (UPF0249 family)